MKSRILIALAVVTIVACQSKADIEFKQYYNRGEVLYTQNCGNCHQKDGKGLGMLYPPLDKSDFVDKDINAVLCIMKYGKSTPTVVNGKTYEQPMKGISTITDLEIAEIATYIYNTWDRQRGIVSVNEVTEKMNNCTAE